MSNLVFLKGNIFESKCQAVVCPVNSLSIMGAGLAKLFRDQKDFDRPNKTYKEACNAGQMAPGAVLTVFPKALDKHKIIMYLATKMDWRDDSQIQWIENGLFNLYKALYHYEIGSVAIPAVGSGKGNLPWSSVELIIKTIFENTDKKVEIYLPHENQ